MPPNGAGSATYRCSGKCQTYCKRLFSVNDQNESAEEGRLTTLRRYQSTWMLQPH